MSMSLLSLYAKDNHDADCGLRPFRWCVSKWARVFSPLNESQCCGEVMQRIVAAILLIVPTILATLLSFFVIGLKKCCPVSQVTQTSKKPRLDAAGAKRELAAPSLEKYARYAPLSGIIVLKKPDRITYIGPDAGMRAFALLPKEGVVLPTGRILPDGNVEGEVLLPLN